MRTAVYAGTFDPITNGHLWVIKQATYLFDEVNVAIGVNPEKKCMFSLEERIEILNTVCRSNGGFGQTVKIKTFSNQFLVDFAAGEGIDYIVRGIRNEQDYRYENGMRHVNADLRPGVETIFLMPPRELSEVSSSLVKGLIGPDRWQDAVKQYVPECVMKKLTEKFDGKR